MAPLVHQHFKHLYEIGRMKFYQNVAANGIGNFQSERFASSEFLVLPPSDSDVQKAIATFTDLTSSTLADQIYNLRRTRDLLLPKLVSGEVDVSEIDITADK